MVVPAEFVGEAPENFEKLVFASNFSSFFLPISYFYPTYHIHMHNFMNTSYP